MAGGGDTNWAEITRFILRKMQKVEKDGEIFGGSNSVA